MSGTRSTGQGGGAPGQPPDATDPRPIERSSGGRYRIGELLGQGGMGRVHEAYDIRLRRRVALKLLHSDEPEQVRRFLREAQAQALVAHENVCKVYEVGELEGRPYIAMQLIEGEPLYSGDARTSGPNPLLRELSLEQKVHILRRVSEGIHAAHRQGLIHRDIKPSNIMIERIEDGSWKPCVLDFGLARPVSAPALTALGMAAGTPQFMAPEQVRGESNLDRRTDVYGLGATLYAILAGRPPFEAPSSFDLMVKVNEEEVPSLRNVPLDVASIVDKCLQKDPAKRYESARALAEDLGRYLDGEPIKARRTSLGYRLSRKAQKHWKLLTAAALALSTVGSLGAANLRAQWRQREVTRLAAAFGQQVTAIESVMRIAHLSPFHDVTPERRMVRQWIADLESRARHIGRLAQGPGHYALGRGYLALREHEQARQHLELAWGSGYQEPEAAYALGLALGALYQDELEEAERIRDRERRDAKKSELAMAYRDPALAYLRQSRGLEVDSPDYVSALVAFYEERYEEALELARAAAGRFPWLYEGRKLEGDIHAAIGRRAQVEGEGFDVALAAFQRSEEAYRAALEAGRSDPSIHEGLCRIANVRMEIDLYGRGADVERFYSQGLAHCQRLFEVDPESHEGYRLETFLHSRMAEHRRLNNSDPSDEIAAAIASAERAIEIEPEETPARQSMAYAYFIQGGWEASRGIDARGSFTASIRTLEEAIAIEPNNVFLHNNLGQTYFNLAGYELERGLDPTKHANAALETFEKALELEPTHKYPIANIGFTRTVLAEHLRGTGRDPSEAVRLAVEALESTANVSPLVVLQLGTVANVHARFLWEHGDDPRPQVERAVGWLERALEANPRLALARSQAAQARWIEASFELEQGRSPLPAIEDGRRRLTGGPEADDGDAQGLLAAARLDLVEARWRIVTSSAPLAVLRRGLARLEEAVSINPRNGEAHAATAELRHLQATWLLDRGQAAEEALTSGLAAAERALAVNPRLAEARALRGALLLQRARTAGDASETLVLEGRAEIARAVAINPNLERRFGPR